MVRGHYDNIQAFYGVDLGLRVARKHLGWYMDHADTPPEVRRRVLTARDGDTVRALLPSALSGAPVGIAA